MIGALVLATTAVASTRAAAAAVPRQSQTQQTPDEQAQAELRQSAAEIRRTALENARAQIEAARAQVDVRTERGVLVVPRPAPATSPRITITRDGQAPIVVSGGPPATSASTGSQNIVFRPEVPAGAVTLGIAFFIMLAFIAVGLPLARAWARRMDRQASSATPAPFPSDVTDRLERIEHAVESIAIEVERVSEGQRFTTKLLADRAEGDAVALPMARPNSMGGGSR